MQGDSNVKALVDNARKMDKSLQELRDLSSQLYNVADYCETAFFKSEDKRIVMEKTKEYISKAVVTVADSLGSISANLEFCLSKSNSIPEETEDIIDILKLRLVTCQQHSQKLALARFFWSTSEFSRPQYHCRYILPRTNLNTDCSHDTKKSTGIEDQFEAEEPLFLHTYNCNPSLIQNSSFAMNTDKNNGVRPPVLPVRDGQSILPNADETTFQFQEGQKLKRSMINWKVMQNKDIASLIRRGKRILA